MTPSKDEYNTFHEQLQRYERTLDRLTALGLRPAPSSRLNAYLQRLRQVSEDPNPFVNLELQDKLTFDLREIDELTEIVEAVPEEPAAVELNRLRLVQKGHENPDNSTADRARDAQYELYLRAILAKGGLSVELREPDLVVRVLGRDVHIAAKRPTSLARLDDRLRDAVSQVEQHPPPGLAALSVDQIIRPRQTLLVVPTMADLQKAVRSLVEQFVYDNRHSMARRLRGKGLAALLLTTRLPGRAASTNHSILGTSLHTEMLASRGTGDHAAVLVIFDAAQRYLGITPDQKPGDAR
jgi:hypothetical protein